jgi:adenosyl cobinamide kinase/adenosyl cobinamide phosphate guanylyltransferase
VITLVLGGARSGKSVVAERLAAKTNAPVTYLATANAEHDDDLERRILAHQLRRPSDWITIECGPDLVDILARTSGTVLIDSLGPWLAALPSMTVDANGLRAVLVARSDDTIIVSEEVGLGVHPETSVGREFRDKLGKLNQMLAVVASSVLLVVAGRVLSLESGDGE